MATIKIEEQEEPSTPESGHVSLYADTADSIIKAKDDTGTVTAYGDTKKTKVSSNDTTEGFLEAKIVDGINSTVTIDDEGGNETLQIDVVVAGVDDTAVDITGAIGSTTHVTNQREFNTHSMSSGVTDGCGITDNGDGTVSIAAGESLIRVSAAAHAELKTTEVTAQGPISLTDDSINYLYLSYNAGSPVIVANTSESSFNCLDKCLMYVIYRNGNTLDYIDASDETSDFSRRARVLFRNFSRFIHSAGGSVISETGTRNLGLTAGSFNYRTTNVPHDAFDTSGAETFTYYYRDGGGGFTEVASSTTISNTQYDDGSGSLAIMGTNKYRVDESFLVSNTPSRIIILYGQAEYNSIEEAKAAGLLTVIPGLASNMGSLVGRAIVKKDGTNLELVESAFTTSFTSSVATNHNGLASLDGGESGYYGHLTSAQHTIATQAASGSVAGYVTTGAQTISGDKTISGTTTFNAAPTSPHTGPNSERFGATSTAAGDDATALGYGTSASGDQSIAIGRGSLSTKFGAIAIGRYSEGIGDYALSIGRASKASKNFSVAIGSAAKSEYAYSVCLGGQATATAENQFVAGSTGAETQDVYFGNGVAHATPVAFTFHGTSGSGTDIAGADIKIASGQGTGTGVSGKIILQTATAGGSGSSLNTLSDRAAIDTIGNMGLGTVSPDASALLEMSSTTKGFAAPRMTTTQRDAISSPATGLVVFDTTLGVPAFYDGAAWVGRDLNSLTDCISDGSTIAIGPGAGASDDLSANVNVYIGVDAGGNNTTGYDNVVIGFEAMHDSTNAHSNVMIGKWAGYESGGNAQHVMIGEGAGYNTYGGNNTAVVGYQANYYNTGGSGTVALGYRAGYGVSLGYKHRNVFIGQEAGSNVATSASDNICIGYDTDLPTAAGDSQLNIGNTLYGNLTTSSISIGSTAPVATAKLEVNSTTQGFLPPVMTTTQKNAISSPATGLMLFDSTLAKLCVYTGAAWETITSA